MRRTQDSAWNVHNFKKKKILLWGLEKGAITVYDDLLIEKLRDIYYGGVPASILVLSHSILNCYDKALLLARAFLNGDDDVCLLYISIDSLRLNPQLARCNIPLWSDHCVVERTTKNGQSFIYDPSSGLVYNKKVYWLMEHPEVRKIQCKLSIFDFVSANEYYHPENIWRDKDLLPLILPMIEKTYGRDLYSQLGIELLQREVEYFKCQVNYDETMKLKK